MRSAIALDAQAALCNINACGAAGCAVDDHRTSRVVARHDRAMGQLIAVVQAGTDQRHLRVHGLHEA